MFDNTGTETQKNPSPLAQVFVSFDNSNFVGKLRTCLNFQLMYACRYSRVAMFEHGEGGIYLTEAIYLKKIITGIYFTIVESFAMRLHI